MLLFAVALGSLLVAVCCCPRISTLLVNDLGSRVFVVVCCCHRISTLLVAGYGDLFRVSFFLLLFAVDLGSLLCSWLAMVNYLGSRVFVAVCCCPRISTLLVGGYYGE